ncbi:lipoprotein [Streptomyces ruber]|uniref:Lipoprotein n=2 Tax=Streptomyces TaxID=1883 RepID=A0A918BBF1_9ACTN|nr:esterase-like activity of phytase family protein [Streptomyces ruber]GGQ55001.1 lipoprotein [Streptomyces ruber]
MRLRLLLATLAAGLTAATTLTAAGPAAASGPRTVNACSPAVSVEGFSDALDKTTYENTYVGNFSALAMDRNGGLLAVSDRSALFSLDRRSLRPTGVVQLADGNGTALDAEGLVVDRDGTRLISDETGPAVRRHARDGRVLEELPVPAGLRVAPAGRATTNGTFEGLTMLPGDRTLLAAMEYAISGDSTDIVRFQTWQRKENARGGQFRLSAQYAYRTDPGLGVPEVTAIPDGRLLVLERGFTAGVGNTVRLYLADPRHATDVGGVDTLTGQRGVRLIRKTLLADLVNCPTLGATAKQPQPNPLLDNIEAMTVTGRGKGGRLDVLLASDDNENAAQTTRFYSLRVRTAK